MLGLGVGDSVSGGDTHYFPYHLSLAEHPTSRMDHAEECPIKQSSRSK